MCIYGSEVESQQVQTVRNLHLSLACSTGICYRVKFHAPEGQKEGSRNALLAQGQIVRPKQISRVLELVRALKITAGLERCYSGQNIAVLTSSDRALQGARHTVTVTKILIMSNGVFCTAANVVVVIKAWALEALVHYLAGCLIWIYIQLKCDSSQKSISVVCQKESSGAYFYSVWAF